MAKSASLGTVFKVGTGSDVKTVGSLTSISGIEVSADTIDVSSMDNSTGYREKVAGLKDPGEVSLSGFYDGSDSGQAELYTLLNSGDPSAFSIVFPTTIGKTWSFNGVVTGFSTSADMDNAITFECTIAVSGKPTLGATESGS